MLVLDEFGVLFCLLFCNDGDDGDFVVVGVFN